VTKPTVVVKTAVDIAASPARVWQVLTDFARYGRWNPVLPRVRGSLEEGAVLHINVAHGPLHLGLSVRLLVVRPERELLWCGPLSTTLGKLVAGRHGFVLEPTASGTRMKHHETFTGSLAGLVVPLLPRLVRHYEELNGALCREAEACGTDLDSK
jgi:hypothetical protein